MIPRILIYISLFICAGRAISAFPRPNNEGLPTARLTRREVQDLKDNRFYPIGHIHGNFTFGEGHGARTVSIVEADYDILLPDDDEDGIRARSLAPRGQCLSIGAPSNSCNINYCWSAQNQYVYSETVTIVGSNGQSNPTRVKSSNPNNLWFNTIFNDGYGGWFPKGNECSNADTEIWTNHAFASGVSGTAGVNGIRCDNCNFRSVYCHSGSPLKDNLGVYSNGVASQSRC